MFLILRIALNIVFASKVTDVRSDDEDTDNELEKKERVAKGTTVAVETVGGSRASASAVGMNGTAVKGPNGSARRREGVKQES